MASQLRPRPVSANRVSTEDSVTLKKVLRLSTEVTSRLRQISLKSVTQPTPSLINNPSTQFKLACETAKEKKIRKENEFLKQQLQQYKMYTQFLEKYNRQLKEEVVKWAYKPAKKSFEQQTDFNSANSHSIPMPPQLQPKSPSFQDMANNFKTEPIAYKHPNITSYQWGPQIPQSDQSQEAGRLSAKQTRRYSLRRSQCYNTATAQGSGDEAVPSNIISIAGTPKWLKCLNKTQAKSLISGASTATSIQQRFGRKPNKNVAKCQADDPVVSENPLNGESGFKYSSSRDRIQTEQSRPSCTSCNWHPKLMRPQIAFRKRRKVNNKLNISSSNPTTPYNIVNDDAAFTNPALGAFKAVTSKGSLISSNYYSTPNAQTPKNRKRCETSLISQATSSAVKKPINSKETPTDSLCECHSNYLLDRKFNKVKKSSIKK